MDRKGKKKNQKPKQTKQTHLGCAILLFKCMLCIQSTNTHVMQTHVFCLLTSLHSTTDPSRVWADGGN